MSATPEIDAMMAEAFRIGRVSRSVEYMAGARAALTLLIEGTPLHNLFAAGTVQADAFFSGMDEGWAIWVVGRPKPVLADVVRTVMVATDHMHAIGAALSTHIAQLERRVAMMAVTYPGDLTWSDDLDVARQALALIEAAA